MNPLAQSLADAFISTFWSADHAVRWTSSEQERHVWLDPRTCLIGTIDATGVREDGKPFFADWKTMNAMRARNMDLVKTEWRFDPQSLTYGVLMPDVRDFTVRWAIKDKVPRCDFEWYTYTSAEVQWWKGELLNIADDIRRLRGGKVFQWPTNPTNCTRYGWNYKCPLYYGCIAQDFNYDPGLPPRDHHLELEDQIKFDNPIYTSNDIVFLSSSAVEMWLGCREKYRRFYEGTGLKESGEALTIGTDFHTLISQHINKLMEQQ